VLQSTVEGSHVWLTGMAMRAGSTRLERQSQYLHRLTRKHVDFENKFTELMLASSELDEQQEALSRAYRKLQFQLKCKSQTSAKMFFGKDAANANDRQTAKMITILEQKLNGKRNRHSTIQHANKVLTSEINEVRYQKVVANEQTVKLDTKFDQRQKDMAGSMSIANKSNSIRLASTEAREAAIAEGDKQETLQNEEMEKLKSFLRAFSKENDFLKTVARQKMTERMAKLQNGSLSALEEKNLRKQMHSMSAKNADERRKIKSATDTLFTYETAFRRLREETKEESMNKIVEIFVNREDENYSLYKYLQRVNESLKVADGQLNVVEESVRKYLQDEEGSSNQRKNRLAQIEARRDALQHRVLSTDEKHKHDVFTQNLWASAVEKFILQILGFGDIVSRIKGMANPNSQMLLQKLISAMGDSLDSTVKRNQVATIVSEANITVVMSLIELCVMEILSEYTELTTGKVGDFGVRVAAGPPKGNPLNVEAPEIEKVPEDEDIRGVPGPLSSAVLRRSFEAQLKQQFSKSRSTSNSPYHRRMIKPNIP